ncbi:hypothetical protein QW131_04540 [Roseibium salinum]|nr:hypothetical protein [Roseibium salinum]
MIALTALIIVVTGATYVKERHMHPLMLLLPIYLFADLERFGFQRRWRWLAAIVIAVAAVAFLARVPGLAAPDRFWCGGNCRHMKPYADLQAPLAGLGAADATLIADDGYTGGNLRVLFPDARIVTSAIPARTAAREKNASSSGRRATGSRQLRPGSGSPGSPSGRHRPRFRSTI